MLVRIEGAARCCASVDAPLTQLGEAERCPLCWKGTVKPFGSIVLTADVGVIMWCRRDLLETGVVGSAPLKPPHFGQRPIGEDAVGESIVLALREPGRLG